MKKMDRLMSIICALRENKRLTAKEIADIFEVSDRTIYRDIDALCQLNVPIKSFEGFEGGYEIDEKYFIPSITFKENEILYLLICLKIGEKIKVPNMKEDYESLKYKLMNILEDDTKKHYKKILERIIFEIDHIILGEYRKDITDIVIKSFGEFKNIIIEYYRPRNNETLIIEITPYVLSYYGGGWYIGGYCHTTKENRFFRIDRIKAIQLSEDNYEQSFIDSYFNGIDKEKDKVTVILEIEKNLYETVKNDKIFMDSEKLEYDGKVKLKLLTSDINTILRIATLDFQKVKIIEPQFLIDQLKDMCKKILDKY